MSLLHRLRKASKLPPHLLLQRILSKIIERSRRIINRYRVYFSPPQISTIHFRRSLKREFVITHTDFESIVNHFRQRSPNFFLPLNSSQKTIRLLNPGLTPIIPSKIKLAEQILTHQFDLLGSGPVMLGHEIDWHRDFKSGYRWRPIYYGDIDYSDLSQPYDVKVPWELSRCQHFVTLGQAYWLTGDEKYTQEFVNQLQSWLESNPPQIGVNWACTMDVAIRAVNWIWALYFFAQSPTFTDDSLTRFLKGILQHGRHIIRNLEDGPIRGNHYLADGVGLVYLGIMFPEFKEAEAWRNKGLEILFGEMLHQVYPDGVDFEASIPYHRLVLELFLTPILLCRLNDIVVPSTVMVRLEKMFEFVRAYTKPDGTIPVWGDADDGRLLRLSRPGLEREFIDHRYLLAIGAVLFNRPDFGLAAGNCWEEAIWLFGRQAVEYRASLPAQPMPTPSVHFPNAGIYIMRQNDLYLLLDAGPNGQDDNGGHAHNDTLSFELFAHGKSFIVDPGSYVYTADYKARNLFRSTAYHNTVIVDGQEVNPFEENRLFSMDNHAKVTVHRWETTLEYDFFDAEHNGYRRLTQPVTHRRQVYFDKIEGWWIIRDLLLGAGSHQLQWNFHFAPEFEDKLICDEGIIYTQTKEANLAIIPASFQNLQSSILPGWVSPSYGVKKTALIGSYSMNKVLPLEMIILLRPFRGKVPAISDLRLAIEKIINHQQYQQLITNT
jgi:uncharacterized heparinase superfamily protein